jgi:nucleotide-binding universal stress UspA family protein
MLIQTSSGAGTMVFKDILAMMTSADEDGVIAAVDALREKDSGANTALLFEFEPDTPSIPDGYMGGEIYSEMVARAHEGYLGEEAKLRARLVHASHPWTIRALSAASGLIASRAAAEARYADVTIMGRPTTPLRKSMFEGVLFGSGRPVLLIPSDWKESSLGRNVVIGWKAKREAARALADARPLIERAERLAVVTVIPKFEGSGRTERPGADVAAHLARCGLKAEVRDVEALGRTEGAALIEACRATDADLLVVGGYGHARLQEIVFGGVTHELINASPIPLFLSH